MIKFSELPVQTSAADHLYESVLQDIGTGTYTPDQIRRMVDEGCAVAIAALKSIDKPMAEALKSFDESEQTIVEMVAVVMMTNTLKAASDVLLTESFFRMLGIPIPRG